MRSIFIQFFGFLYFCMLCGAGHVYAQQMDIHLKKAWEDVSILCADSLAGRGYVEDGHVKAAEYLLKRYREIGLQPIPRTRSFFQPFPFMLNYVSDASLHINGKQLEAASEFTYHRLSSKGAGVYKVKQLGYGLKNKGGMKGRAVVFKEGWPEKLRNKPSKQAKFLGRQKVEERILAIRPTRPAVVLVLKKKLTTGFGPESLGLPILEVRADAIPKKIKQVAFSIESNQERIRSQNVIGIVPGTAFPDSAIIVSAHYDHLGKLGEGIFPGANDNASGIAMLLSLAAHFKQKPLPYSLVFIAFGAEETGLNGSRYYVEADPIVPLAQTKFILNLDLMGNGDEGIMAVGGKDFPDLFKRLELVNQELEAVPQVRARINAPNSDHYFFLVNGVPGFFIYTLGGPPHYHDVNDTVENLLLSKFVEIRKLFIEFIEEM